MPHPTTQPETVGLSVGRERWEFRAAAGRTVPLRREATPAPEIADVAAAVRDALEHPVRFVPLRQALTPDDRVAVVVDEALPRLGELLRGILEAVTAAGVRPEAITLLAPPGGRADWCDELPDAFADVRVESHHPGSRDRLSYLASTAAGRRVYLNRTLVDADQSVVLTGRRFDPARKYTGAQGALFPALSNAETRRELLDRLAPEGEEAAGTDEAGEITWLLGAPVFVQVIEGEGDTVAHVLAGLADSAGDAEALLESRWHVYTDRPADTVVASLSGDPARHGFAELAHALASAARAVRPGGRIVLLSRAAFPLSEAGEVLRHSGTPDAALRELLSRKPAGWPEAFQWAGAARDARLYLYSGLPPEEVGALFAAPLAGPDQVQELLDAGGDCLFLPDAHKVRVTVG